MPTTASSRFWPPTASTWVKALAFIAILIVAWYVAFQFPWGNWPPSEVVMRWPPHQKMPWKEWKAEPTATADKNVLTTLLTQNREEVRFWQGVLFNTSLAFIGGVLGIVSLGLTRARTDWVRSAYTAAVVFLCAFYLIFVKVAENSIALNHRDLSGIEIALKLSKTDAYIQGDKIYDHSKGKQQSRTGEKLIAQLVPFGVVLGVFSCAALLFLPPAHPQAEGGREQVRLIPILGRRSRLFKA